MDCIVHGVAKSWTRLRGFHIVMYNVYMYVFKAFLKIQSEVKKHPVTEAQSDSHASWKVIYGFSTYLMSINFAQSS